MGGSFPGNPPLQAKKAFSSGEISDYFVTGNLTCAGEYPGFCVIAGVVTTHRFLQHLQAASRVSL